MLLFFFSSSPKHVSKSLDYSPSLPFGYYCTTFPTSPFVSFILIIRSNSSGGIICSSFVLILLDSRLHTFFTFWTHPAHHQPSFSFSFLPYWYYGCVCAPQSKKQRIIIFHVSQLLLFSPNDYSLSLLLLLNELS